jgi:hypothetical protein
VLVTFTVTSNALMKGIAMRVCLLCFTLLTTSLRAQVASKGEVFGGYQHANLSDGIATKRLSSNGWNAAFAYYFSRWVGVKADFGGAYATDNTSSFQPFSVKTYTYTFGPVFSPWKDKRFTPFGEALFGRYHETLAGYPNSDSAFAMLAGGGVDVRIARQFSVRAIQVDWLYTRPPSAVVFLQANSVRIGAGIVFRF